MLCLLWPTGIPYIAVVKEMAWVDKISKSPQSHKLPPSHSLLPGRAPRAAGALCPACSSRVMGFCLSHPHRRCFLPQEENPTLSWRIPAHRAFPRQVWTDLGWRGSFQEEVWWIWAWEIYGCRQVMQMGWDLYMVPWAKEKPGSAALGQRIGKFRVLLSSQAELSVSAGFLLCFWVL